MQHKAAKSKKASPKSPKITYDPRHCGRNQLKSSIRAIFDALSFDEYQAGLVSARSVRDQLEADAKLAAGSLKPRKKLKPSAAQREDEEAAAEEEFDELREIARGVDSLVTRDRLDENSGVTIGGINGKALAPVPDALDDDDEQLVEEWREIAQMREASTEDTRSQL